MSIYTLTQDVKAASVGFVRGKGGSIGISELPPALFGQLLAEGVIVEVQTAVMEPEPESKPTPKPRKGKTT